MSVVPSPTALFFHADAIEGAGKDLVGGLGSSRPVTGIALRGTQDFTKFGSVFFPGPGYLDAPWRRQHMPCRRW